MKTYLLLLLMQLFYTSCEEKPLPPKIVGYYFQYERVNYAWGFNHGGFTITPSGEVYTFNKTTPWVFAQEGKLSMASMKKNLEASSKCDTLINPSDIIRFQQLATKAVWGKMSERVQEGADMGSSTTKIIIPDSTDTQWGYREVHLTTEGDFRQSNLAPEAAVIAEWLKKLKIH